ncbi:MAG: biopolymer transporter ExbD [Deltaproteobacteria bacterium]|nr:biopolymer transporter ExbD [Deltaproteobacteria bacterium]
MGAAAGGNDEEAITGINVTPLVDITLVLLIIFMVTATYIVTPSIKVELPKAANSEQSAPSTAAIVIGKDGKYYLNAKEVTEPELVKAVSDAYAANNDLQAIISADKLVYHGSVVHVIDVVKGIGVAKFAISIEKESK